MMKTIISDADKTIKILTVTIGAQYFGVDISRVNAILSRQECTVVPQAGERIAGLINVRGHIVALIDVRLCLGMNSTDNAQMSVMIERGAELYGLLFDTVGEIIDVNPSDMEPIPAILEERWQGMATGIFRRPDSLLIMLDDEKLIESSRPSRGEAA